MRKPLAVILAVILAALHVIVLGKTSAVMRSLPKGEGTAFIVPAPILKITALEFDGLASDALFLKVLVFIGGAQERKERPMIKDWEWKWMNNVLEASTGLDPYFFDPYFFANAHLAWAGNMVRETNRLLEKGSRSRDWDWRLPFFLGFNEFYFLQEDEKASLDLMEASRRPGASPLFASLASKLAFKERRTENAIFFLEQMIGKTDDEAVKKEFETRLEALRSIDQLEKAVVRYHARYGRMPKNLEELVSKKVLDSLPRDPMGGEFYMDSRGIVKTTSEGQLMPYFRNR